jgi:hypothetical protein
MHNKSWSSSIVHRHSLNLTIPSKGEIFKVVSAKEDQPITLNEVKRFRADRMSRRADVQEGMSALKRKGTDSVLPSSSAPSRRSTYTNNCSKLSGYLIDKLSAWGDART